MSQAGTTHHKFGEGYSGNNPVPSVQSFRKAHAEQAAAATTEPPSPPPSDPDVNTPTDGDTSLDVDKDLPPKPAPTPAANAEDGPQLASPPPSATADNANANGTGSTDTANAGNGNGKDGRFNAAPTNGNGKPAEPGRKQGETKKEVMDKANANKMKPTDRLKNNKAERTVRDPVTGLDVVVKDAVFSSAFFYSLFLTLVFEFGLLTMIMIMV